MHLIYNLFIGKLTWCKTLKNTDFAFISSQSTDDTIPFFSLSNLKFGDGSSGSV